MLRLHQHEYTILCRDRRPRSVYPTNEFLRGRDNDGVYAEPAPLCSLSVFSVNLNAIVQGLAAPYPEPGIGPLLPPLPASHLDVAANADHLSHDERIEIIEDVRAYNDECRNTGEAPLTSRDAILAFCLNVLYTAPGSDYGVSFDNCTPIEPIRGSELDRALDNLYADLCSDHIGIPEAKYNAYVHAVKEGRELRSRRLNDCLKQRQKRDVQRDRDRLAVSCGNGDPYSGSSAISDPAREEAITRLFITHSAQFWPLVIELTLSGRPVTLRVLRWHQDRNQDRNPDGDSPAGPAVHLAPDDNQVAEDPPVQHRTQDHTEVDYSPVEDSSEATDIHQPPAPVGVYAQVVFRAQDWGGRVYESFLHIKQRIVSVIANACSGGNALSGTDASDPEEIQSGEVAQAKSAKSGEVEGVSCGAVVQGEQVDQAKSGEVDQSKSGEDQEPRSGAVKGGSCGEIEQGEYVESSSGAKRKGADYHDVSPADVKFGGVIRGIGPLYYSGRNKQGEPVAHQGELVSSRRLGREWSTDGENIPHRCIPPFSFSSSRL